MRLALIFSVCVIVSIGGANVASAQTTKSPTSGKTTPTDSSNAQLSTPNSGPVRDADSQAARKRLAQQQRKCMKNCMGGNGGLSYDVCYHSCF